MAEPEVSEEEVALSRSPVPDGGRRPFPIDARTWLTPVDLDLRPVTPEITDIWKEARLGGGPTLTPYQEEAVRIG